jgi:hypothetical protein
MVDAVAWNKCSQVLSSLSVPERIALRSVEKGMAESVDRDCLDRLHALSLVAYDGYAWRLTDNGRAIAQFC